MSKLERYRVVREQTSLLSRVRDAMRSYWAGPWTLKDRELSGHFNAGRGTSTGLAISEHSALNYSAVWAATNTISSDVGTFPLLHYKLLPDGGKLRMRGSSLYRLLHDAPNPEMTSVVWRRTVQAHALTWGNGYSEIERDQSDRPIALWPITPDRVMPFRQSPDSELEYIVLNPSGSQAVVSAKNMIHIRGLGFDGERGYSVIAHARESIGLGMAAEQFGGTFFGNGATFGGVIAYKGPKPPEMADKNYIDALKSKHVGVERAHQLLALYNDAKYERMGIPPNDAQFLETRQFQVTEIARWFNIPPHKLGDLTRATFSNIEQQTIDYYTTTLMPWLAVWEQELTSKLVPGLEKNIQFIEHLVDGLLRGDVTSRSTSYGQQFNVGGITPNEIRASENRNKIVGGDRAFVMRNMIPLDRIDEVINAEIAAAKAPKPEPVQKPTVDTSARVEALEKELALARRKAQEAEDAKDIANSSLTAVRVDLLHEQEAHLETLRSSEAEVARLTVQATSLGTDLATATRDLTASKDYGVMIEADYQRVCGEKEDLAQSWLAGLKRCEQADAEIVTLTRQAEALSLDIVVARQETERADVKASEAEQRTQVSEAVNALLREQVTTLTTEAETRRVELAESITREAGLVLVRDAERALRIEVAESAEAMAHKLRGVTDTLRSALSYSVSAIIRRESDRARKAQASPEKLLRHVENFYGTHGEYCREALRPILRAVAAIDGRDANEILSQLVPAMVEESTVQLRLVASDTDPETLAPALERVLRRWEAERGDAVADRLMKEGAANGR